MRLTLAASGFLVLALLVVSAILFYLAETKRTENVGNEPSDRALRHQIEKRAASGDPQAQLALSIILQGSEEEERLLRAAAEGGSKAAIVDLARMRMSVGDVQMTQSAGALLEQAARGGYYPAVMELADCISRRACGSRSFEEALTWAMASRHWSTSRRIKNNMLSDLEAELRQKFTPEQVKIIESRAKALSIEIQMSD